MMQSIKTSAAAVANPSSDYDGVAMDSFEDIMAIPTQTETDPYLRSVADDDSPPDFGEGGGFIALPPGTYKAVLESVKKSTMKEYKNPTKEVAAIAFRFKIPKHSTTVSKKVTPRSHPKSNCYKLACQLNGGPLQESVTANNASYWTLLKSFVGKEYLIALSQSPDGKWNNIESLTSLSTLMSSIGG